MLTIARTDYERIFQAERVREYPVIDALEARLGYAVGRLRLERAAAVLACPLKAHPPNWQHGRVLYAVARRYLAQAIAPVTLLDVGTAKGFSALCLQWALDDAGVVGTVHSVDVIDPQARAIRNTVAEVDGPKTLVEILSEWPEASRIAFAGMTGRRWLTGHPGRVHLAYVDGKHTYDEVSWEAALLATRQLTGDVIVFDDLQSPGVAHAVEELRGYAIEHVAPLPERQYAIARQQ